MRRKIFSVLVALVLVLSLGLVTAVPAAAQDPATLKVSKWTESSANPIFDPDAKAYYPTVVKLSANDYRMWYGSNSGVGYATSPDGLSWAEEVNPVSGLTSANHPLVECYTEGFVGSDVGDNPSADTMYYRIWYWDTAQLYSVVAIRYAESPDGVTWYNDQPLQQVGVPIISGVHPEWNRGSYGPCDVLYNPDATNTGTDWVFTMYYDGTTGGDESIGVGFSSDGITWTGYDSDSDGKADPVLTGSGSGWDATYVSRCTVIKGDDQYRMWFSGGDGRMDHGIGYATSSDGLTWTKDANNPIFHKGDGVSWRDERTYCPMVIEDGGIYKVWFSGKDTATGNYAIGYATNPNPDAAYTSIQSAINAANPDDTITVAAGTYNENLLIDKALTLTGTDGATETIIDGTSTYIVNIVHSDVTFEGFMVTNPENEGGGDISGILIGGWNYTPIPENVKILNNIVKQVRSETGTPSTFATTGINVGTSKNVVISGNTITDIKNPGDPVGSSASDHTCGINVWGDTLTGSSRNIVISNNIISDIKYNGIILEGAIDVQIGENDITGCESGVRVKPREGEISNVQIGENDITGCEYGISVVPEAFTLSGLTISLNDFADNGIQVLDDAEVLDIQDVLDTNEFDRAVVVGHASLLHTIWSSIQDAVNEAVSDDTIIVAPGTYNEVVTIDRSLTLNGAKAGEDARTRTFTDESILDGTGLTPAVGVGAFNIEDGVSDVIIDGFEVCNYQSINPGGGSGVLAYSYGPATQGLSDITIQNNYLHDLGWNGVCVWSNNEVIQDDFTIQYNLIEEAPYAGIELTNVTDSKVLNNKVIAPTVIVDDPGDAGVGIEIAARAQAGFTITAGTDVLVEGNEISGTFAEGSRAAINILSRTYASNSDATLTGVTVKGNTVSANVIVGILAVAESRDSGPATITNLQIVDDNTITGFSKSGIVVKDVDSVQVEGNTISATDHSVAPNGIQIGYLDGVPASSGTTGTVNDNQISGCYWTDYNPAEQTYEDEWTGSGILVIDTESALEISGNEVQSCDVGLDIEAGPGTFMANNDVHDNSYGFVLWNADPIISFNNIYQNALGGVYRTTGGSLEGTLDATNNWWETTDEADIEAMVSGNVDYDPWIGAGVKNSKSKKTAADDDTVDAKDKTDTKVGKKGKGTPTITVTEYTDNPGDGAPGGFSSAGKYIDVHLDDTADVTEIEIRNYYTLEDIAGLNEATLRLSWWNGTAWIECSDSGVTYPDGGPTYRGSVWAIIKEAGAIPSTIPTLDDLAGTPFMSMARPAPTGGGGGIRRAPPAGTTDVRGQVSDVGVFLSPVTAISEDELCTLTIPEGTVGLTEELEPLTEITIVTVDEPPPPPEGVDIVLAYDLGPNGATFEPAITLTFSYDPADIPEGKDVLIVAYYDEATNAWVYLEVCVVDTENNTITAPVSHFTTFAIIARALVSPPALAPAAFTSSSLSISPVEVDIGETVTISVLVANTGEEQGSYTITLKIDGVVEETKEIALAGGASETVTLATAKDEAGTYSVGVDGLTGSFTVREVTPPVPPPPMPAPTPPPGINWAMWGPIIGVVVFLAIFLPIRLRRRRAS